MAKHEILIHENTGATKVAAPYLGSYISKETVRLAGYAEQVSAKCGLPAIQVQAIITGAFEAWEELEKEALTRIHTDIGTIYGVITGSFPTSDAAFDPEVNALELALRLDDAIRLDLADVTPVVSTDESVTKMRLDNVVDVATVKPYNLIHGGNATRLQGYNMVATDAEWEAYFENALGVRFPFVITEDVSKQLKIGHLDPAPTEGCDGKMVVKSKAGDPTGPLQTSFRKVKYLKVASAGPRIDKGYPSTDPSRVGVYVLYGGFTLEGERLTGGTLKLKYSTDGKTMQEVALISDMYAVTDTKIDLVPNAISDYIEMSHNAVKPVLTVTTPEGSASYAFTSSGD